MRKQAFGIGLILAAIIVVACASVPPDRAVLSTLQTIKASAISSMTVIGQLYTLGQVTEEQKAKAIDIYNRIEVGCKAVAAAASTVTTAQQGADLTAPLQQLADQLSQMVKQYQLGGAK